MTYLILEIQENAEGSVGTLITTKTTRLEAESAYHTAMAAAAVSALARHTVVLLTVDGNVVMSGTYEHGEA